MTSARLPYASSAPTRRRGVSRWSPRRAHEASPKAPSSAPRDARRRGRGRRAPPASFSASHSWTKTPSRRRRRDEALRVTLFSNEPPRFVPTTTIPSRESARRTERDPPPPRHETRFLPGDENYIIRRPEENASRRLRSRRRVPLFRVARFRVARNFCFRAPRPLEDEKRPRLSPARRATAARWTASPGTRPSRHFCATRDSPRPWRASPARERRECASRASRRRTRRRRVYASDRDRSKKSPPENLFGRTKRARATEVPARRPLYTRRHAPMVFLSYRRRSGPPSPCARRASRRAPREDAT
mmetsp:Transcript_2233/g.9290  ORF Transcript_2233/g.9290 Transcript_2233/m.9290 type:complete len:302 (-) Transcript_2233:1219-2124(-)